VDNQVQLRVVIYGLEQQYFELLGPQGLAAERIERFQLDFVAQSRKSQNGALHIGMGQFDVFADDFRLFDRQRGFPAADLDVGLGRFNVGHSGVGHGEGFFLVNMEKIKKFVRATTKR